MKLNILLIGGGVIVTDDEKVAKKAKYLTTTAKIPHPFEYVHDEIGYNYRMPNLNASLLVAQLEQLDEFIENKRALASKYEEFFNCIDEIDFIQEPKNSKSNYWLQAIILKDSNKRDEFLEYTNQNGVMTRPIWKLMNKLDMFKDAQCGNYPIQNISNKELSISQVVWCCDARYTSNRRWRTLQKCHRCDRA